MKLKELTSPSLTDLFVEEMERMILSGELKIGEKLPTEREISEKMKVSRAVVNGGLNQLAEIGFVRIAPRKGAFVDDYIANGNIDVLSAIMEYNGGRFTPEFLEPILQFRKSIEPYATELAAQNAKPENLDALKKIIEQISTADPIDISSELVFQYYHTIAIAGQNIILPLLFRTFKPAYLSIGGAFIRLGNLQSLIEDFQYIYQAIAEKRPEDAKNRDIQSIENCRTTISAHYKPGDVFYK